MSDDTVALARIVANDQERAIDGTRQILSDLAAIPEVRAGDPQRSRTYFAVLMKLYPGYTSFSVVAPDGAVLVSLPPAERPTNFSDRLWFERALATQDFAVGDYQVGQLTGKHVVVAAWPVVDEPGPRRLGAGGGPRRHLAEPDRGHRATAARAPCWSWSIGAASSWRATRRRPACSAAACRRPR